MYLHKFVISLRTVPEGDKSPAEGGERVGAECDEEGPRDLLNRNRNKRRQGEGLATGVLWRCGRGREEI
jgi:hypothetical protein